MIRIIKKINKILNRQQKGKLVVLFFMMVVLAVFNVMGVGMMLPLVNALMDKDILTKSELAARVAAFFGVHDSIGFVILCVIALIIIFVVKDLYAIFQTYVQNRFVFNNRFYAQSKLLAEYMKKPYEFFLNSSSGEIIRIIQQDIGNSFTLLFTILYFFSELTVTVALGIAVFVISPFMTVFVGSIMLITALVIIKIIKPKLNKAGQEAVRHSAEMNKWLIQSMHGIKEIRVAGTEDFFQKNFDRSGKHCVESSRKISGWNEFPRLLIEMTSISTALIAIVIQAVNGAEITAMLTQLSAFVMAATRLLPSANRIVNSASNVAYYEPSLDNVLKLMDERQNESINNTTAEEKTDDNVVISVKEKVTLKEISYAYPDRDVEVLTDASMEIPIGRSVGIVGASGAGKTTSVDIMLGLLAPKKGKVLADGVDVRKNLKSWLSHISYIPQTIFMLDGTIRENVIFGEEKNDEKKIWRCLEEAQLADYVHTLPKGLDTEIGERGIRLSGGQRQRIGIARALYSEPEILVFDEATSSLDNDTESAIMEAINALHGRKTLIIIAHRLSTIEGCDIVYRVEDQKIIRER